MAQTGYTPILIYSSSTAAQAPAAGNLTNSTLGSELAINITDGKLFYKDNANAVQVIAWKTTPTTAGGTGLTSYTAGDLLYYATGTTLSKLAIGANKTILTSSGTAPQWSTSLDTTQGGTGLTSYTAGDLPYYATGTALSKLGIGAANTVLTSSGTAPQWTVQSSLSVGTAANLLSNATTGVMQIVGPGAGTTRVMTIPNANFTAARTDAGQTFTGNQIIDGNFTVRGSSGDFTGVSATLGGTNNPLFTFNMTDGSGRYRFNMNSDTDIKFETIVSGVWAPAWQVDRVTRDVTFNTGNLIQGTAAKGINFTANTSAAGKTSQLLNYYEEGTFTPTVGGTWTTNPTSLSGTYTRIGRVVNITFTFTGGAKSSATAGWIDSMPFNISVSGTGAVVDSNIGNYGLALAANTTRVWLTANAFGAGTNYVSVMYMV